MDLESFRLQASTIPPDDRATRPRLGQMVHYREGPEPDQPEWAALVTAVHGVTGTGDPGTTVDLCVFRQTGLEFRCLVQKVGRMARPDRDPGNWHTPERG